MNAADAERWEALRPDLAACQPVCVTCHITTTRGES